MYLLKCIVNVKLNQSRKAYRECKMAAIEMFYLLDLLMLSEKCFYVPRRAGIPTMMSKSETFKTFRVREEAMEKRTPHSK